MIIIMSLILYTGGDVYENDYRVMPISLVITGLVIVPV